MAVITIPYSNLQFDYQLNLDKFLFERNEYWLDRFDHGEVSDVDAILRKLVAVHCHWANKADSFHWK